MRIGIFLIEDKKKNITFHIPSENKFKLYFANNEIELTNETCYEVIADQNLILKSSEKIINIGKKAIIKPVYDYSKIYPKIGITVYNVITGRKFHWRKEVNQYLIGDLEFNYVQGYITLVNDIDLENYLMCVATSEMSPKCPISMLEAQTIAARSWILANVEKKHINEGFDVCNDDCCQRYQGTGNLTLSSIQAVKSTKGQVLIYNDKICDARYSKSCGGYTESYINVWDNKDIPYLTSFFDGKNEEFFNKNLKEEFNFKEWVESNPNSFCSPYYIPEIDLKQYLGYVDEEGKYFRWELKYTQEELKDIIQKKLSLNDLNLILDIKLGERGNSGRLKDISVIYKDTCNNIKDIKIISEYKIREVLHTLFLYSSAFYLDIKRDDKNLPIEFILKGAGWGHGVGLCQIGALGMSLAGYNCYDILTHYYKMANIIKLT